MVRCFIGVSLPNGLINVHLEDWVGKRIDDENLHINLFFLSEIKDTNSIVKKLDSISHNSFSINLGGLSAFPSENNAKVLIVNADSDELVSLHNKIVNVLNVKESKPFKPHVTLMRVKKHGNMNIFSQAVNKSFRVSDFCLFKSVLSSSGSEYSVLHSFNLGGSV